MNQRTILIIASISGTLAVGLGAFGAHALKETLMATGRNETYELAVRYQFYHTLALLAIGILCEKFPAIKTAAVAFVLGIIVFSGSLYTLALTNQTWLGAVTPIGGVLLIVGWMGMAWTLIKTKG